jgi:hypothetical protein
MRLSKPRSLATRAPSGARTLMTILSSASKPLVYLFRLNVKQILAVKLYSDEVEARSSGRKNCGELSRARDESPAVFVYFTFFCSQSSMNLMI